MKTNFFGTQNVCKELLPLIKPQGESGKISGLSPSPSLHCLSDIWSVALLFDLNSSVAIESLSCISTSLTFKEDSRIHSFQHPHP